MRDEWKTTQTLISHFAQSTHESYSAAVISRLGVNINLVCHWPGNKKVLHYKRHSFWNPRMTSQRFHNECVKSRSLLINRLLPKRPHRGHNLCSVSWWLSATLCVTDQEEFQENLCVSWMGPADDQSGLTDFGCVEVTHLCENAWSSSCFLSSFSFHEDSVKPLWILFLSLCVVIVEEDPVLLVRGSNRLRSPGGLM